MVQQNGDLLKGALIGGILGGAAALLLAPKSGKELRDDIGDTYNKLSATTQDVAENLRQTGRKCLHPFQDECEENHNSSFLIGGAIGAVIGVVAALLLAPQSGEELRDVLGDKYESIREKAEDFASDINSKRRSAMDQVSDWKDTLMTIVNKLSSRKGKKSPLRLDEMLEWAGLGLNLMQQLQKRR